MLILCFFFFNDTATTEIYTLSLHDALPICTPGRGRTACRCRARLPGSWPRPPPGQRAPALQGGDLGLEQLLLRSEEHTSELQSRQYLVCRLLLEKKKKSSHYFVCRLMLATK